LTITETWLQKYDDLDAIVGQSDQMALGAVQACTDAVYYTTNVFVNSDNVAEYLE